jgi:hypothetical protein
VCLLVVFEAKNASVMMFLIVCDDSNSPFSHMGPHLTVPKSQSWWGSHEVRVKVATKELAALAETKPLWGSLSCL